MTLYITIVNLNCEPLKQGLKIYMVFFIKYILYIHLTKESCKHFNFPPLTRTAQKVVQCWMLQGLIIANADLSVFWLSNFYLFIYLLLWFAYSGVLLMTAFLKIYPIPKIRNIPIYRLAYSIAMYRIATPVSWYVSYRQGRDRFVSTGLWYIEMVFGTYTANIYS